VNEKYVKTIDLAGAEYLGRTGITDTCIRAITGLLHSGEVISQAWLLTCGANHGFLLVNEFENLIAVKAGFGSGYSGEGPRGLAIALALLYRHNAQIEEYEVSSDFMHRLQSSCLLRSDIEFVRNGSSVRPQRWSDYVVDQDLTLRPPNKRLFHYYPSAVPFRLIDERIIDLAVNFRTNEDSSLVSAYRRLEDVVRQRTGLTDESGTKLFAKTFSGDSAILTWDLPDEGEIKGRAALFNSVYMAYRNARAHREQVHENDESLREFLLVNELFRLEACAKTKPLPDP